LDDRDSIPDRSTERISFCSPSRPERLWRGPRLLSNGYREPIPGAKVAGVWSWPLTSV